MKNLFSLSLFILTVLTINIITFNNIFPQNEPANEFSIKFGGYINWSALYDSRQTVGLREGYFLLYPADKKNDKNGKDINDKSTLNFLSIQTRLNSKIEGPKALGAATSGFIEAEFFGTSEGDMNGLRLRHAYLSLKWTNASLLIGQTWHPMFISEAYPMVVSFNTGAPFIAFSRNPQIRFNYSFDNFTLISALISQRDFTSNGPNGFSSVYMRNAGIPALHLQLKYNSNNILAGIGGGVKKIVPQIETSKKISTDESLTSFDGISYVKYSSTNFAVALQGIYGQNLADFLMLGGYGVCESDTATGNQCYTNQKAYSLWSDIYYGTDIQAGLFFGYSKNLGSDKKIIGASYSRVNNIDDIFRVSPRIVYRTGKIVLAAEFEYTKAGYGLQDSYGKVPSPYKVKNSRVLLGVFYNF